MDDTKLTPAPLWLRLAALLIRRLPAGRYRTMNRLCRHPRGAPFVHPLGITSDRMRFFCDLRDGIAREACFMGYYEPQETVLLQHLLRPGMRFVDVGANWGYFTLLAADLVGPTGRVAAFEPHPMLFSFLANNVSVNNLVWVTPLQVAVAGTKGEMSLAGFEDNTTNWGVSRLTERNDSKGPTFRVRTDLLEPLLNNQGIDEVDLIKIDIEGAEAMVLPAMAAGLSRARYKRILLELHPTLLANRNTSAKAIMGELLSYGYRAWQVDHSPATFRSAAYHLPKSPKDFLVPFDLKSPLDDWPHILLEAPDAEPLW